MVVVVVVVVVGGVHMPTPDPRTPPPPVDLHNPDLSSPSRFLMAHMDDVIFYTREVRGRGRVEGEGKGGGVQISLLSLSQDNPSTLRLHPRFYEPDIYIIHTHNTVNTTLYETA